MLLLALVLVVSLTFWTRQENDHREGQRDYSDAEALSGFSQQKEKRVAGQAEEGMGEELEQVDTSYAAELSSVNLAALREVNGDVVGWIDIPGTEVSYPLVQGEDNQYYLEHTWKQNKSSVGAIFLDYEVSSDFSAFNTWIYGHRMRDETMFGSLKRYKDIRYWQEHPNVYIVTDAAVYRYEIYAAYESGVDEITFYPELTDQETREEFIRYGGEMSVLDTGIVPTTEDHILTLTTCTGRGYASRWVIQAVLVESVPTEMGDT